jgi:hypothetical protein
MGYNVVFEGTGGPNSNYEGIRTWTTYASQEEFEEWRAAGRVGRDRIIAQGVSDQEANQLTAKTTGTARARLLKEQIRKHPEQEQYLWLKTFLIVSEEGHVDEFLQEMGKP